MGESLRDQLLKAGLVSRQKVKETRADKRKVAKQGRHNGVPLIDDLKEETRRLAAEKADRDRTINREHQAAVERNAREAEVDALIAQHRIPREGDLPYHFADGAVLKKLLVTQSLRERLAAGALGIVRTRRGYELVPREVAGRIRARYAQALVLLNDPNPAPAQDEHPIPDDLIW